MTSHSLRRTCIECKGAKTLSDFYRYNTGGLFLRCKACCIEARKAAYKRDPQRTKDQVARYRAEARSLKETQ